MYMKCKYKKEENAIIINLDSSRRFVHMRDIKRDFGLKLNRPVIVKMTLHKTRFSHEDIIYIEKLEKNTEGVKNERI